MLGSHVFHRLTSAFAKQPGIWIDCEIITSIKIGKSYFWHTLVQYRPAKQLHTYITTASYLILYRYILGLVQITAYVYSTWRYKLCYCIRRYGWRRSLGTWTVPYLSGVCSRYANISVKTSLLVGCRWSWLCTKINTNTSMQHTVSLGS